MHLKNSNILQKLHYYYGRILKNCIVFMAILEKTS